MCKWISIIDIMTKYAKDTYTSIRLNYNDSPAKSWCIKNHKTTQLEQLDDILIKHYYDSIEQWWFDDFNSIKHH